MKRVLLVLASVVIMAGGLLTAQSPELASPKLRIEWDEFKRLYDAKKVELVDVRGAQVYDNGHIPGARSMPLDTVEQRIDELKRIGKAIVFYCA